MIFKTTVIFNSKCVQTVLSPEYFSNLCYFSKTFIKLCYNSKIHYNNTINSWHTEDRILKEFNEKEKENNNIYLFFEIINYFH